MFPNWDPLRGEGGSRWVGNLNGNPWFWLYGLVLGWFRQKLRLQDVATRSTLWSASSFYQAWPSDSWFADQGWWFSVATRSTTWRLKSLETIVRFEIRRYTNQQINRSKLSQIHLILIFFGIPLLDDIYIYRYMYGYTYIYIHIYIWYNVYIYMI